MTFIFCMHFIYWGSVPLGQNFTGTGSSPVKNVDTVRYVVIMLQLCHWKFLDNETL